MSSFPTLSRWGEHCTNSSLCYSQARSETSQVQFEHKSPSNPMIHFLDWSSNTQRRCHYATADRYIVHNIRIQSAFLHISVSVAILFSTISYLTTDCEHCQCNYLCNLTLFKKIQCSQNDSHKFEVTVRFLSSTCTPRTFHTYSQLKDSSVHTFQSVIAKIAVPLPRKLCRNSTERKASMWQHCQTCSRSHSRPSESIF